MRFTECDVYTCQSSCNELIKRTLTSVIKKRHYIKEKIKDATHIGILICSLSIQDLLERINKVKRLCKKANKKCYIISVGRPNVAKLANFPEVIILCS
jgi:diphthamide biosynthesis protein 2